MTRLRAFGAFLYDFVIGDDPMIAAVIVVALGVTALIASGGNTAWWITPPAVIGALAFSLHRATQTAAPLSPWTTTIVPAPTLETLKNDVSATRSSGRRSERVPPVLPRSAAAGCTSPPARSVPGRRS
jgi:hypothetical protein